MQRSFWLVTENYTVIVTINAEGIIIGTTPPVRAIENTELNQNIRHNIGQGCLVYCVPLRPKVLNKNKDYITDVAIDIGKNSRWAMERFSNSNKSTIAQYRHYLSNNNALKKGFNIPQGTGFSLRLRQRPMLRQLALTVSEHRRFLTKDFIKVNNKKSKRFKI